MNFCLGRRAREGVVGTRSGRGREDPGEGSFAGGELVREYCPQGLSETGILPKGTPGGFFREKGSTPGEGDRAFQAGARVFGEKGLTFFESAGTEGPTR